jgi:hypothetical protein
MLTIENIDGLTVLIDNAKKFKNPILEKFDGVVIKMGVKGVDSYLSNIIPEEFWDEINNTVAGILSKDYAVAVKELMELIAEILIKYVVPKLDKEIAEG